MQNSAYKRLISSGMQKNANRTSHFDEVCDCSEQAFPKLRVIWTSLSILWKQVMSLSHLLYPSITCKTPDPWLVTYRLQKEMIWFWGKVTTSIVFLGPASGLWKREQQVPWRCTRRRLWLQIITCVRFSIRLSGSSFFVTIYVDVHSIVVHETDVELQAAFSL